MGKIASYLLSVLVCQLVGQRILTQGKYQQLLRKSMAKQLPNVSRDELKEILSLVANVKNMCAILEKHGEMR
jgi:hypothetical protein